MAQKLRMAHTLLKKDDVLRLESNVHIGLEELWVSRRGGLLVAPTGLAYPKAYPLPHARAAASAPCARPGTGIDICAAGGRYRNTLRAPSSLDEYPAAREEHANLAAHDSGEARRP
jgi:hypothetical protein